MTFKSLFKAGLLATASLAASTVPAAADPISIALLSTVGFSSAAIGGGLLAATTAGLQVLAGTALSFGLNFLSTTLSEKPRGLGGSRTQVQIGADLPRQVIFGRGATGGSPVYISGRGKKNSFLTIVFRLADWECDSLENVWIEGDRRNLTSVPVVGTEHARYLVGGTTNKIVIRFFRGTMTQAADSELIADEAGSNGTRIGAWTANHRLAGICYASVRVEYGTENMPSVPSIVFGVKGAKLYDWRKDSTNGGSGAHRWSDPTTWEWSDNPAVCDYNFRRGFYRNGIRVLGMGVPSSDLLLDYYTAAANVCDETITEGGATERRYRVGVIVPDDAEWRVAVDAFRASMAGEVVERAGTFGVIAGGAYAPVMTITDDDMRADAPSSFSRKVPRSELYNAVAVTWSNPRIRYESDTLTPLTNSTYETEDNLERIVKPVDLSMVYKPYQARRVGRIILEQSRMQAIHVGVYPAKFSALEPGDWVTRTFNRDGLGSVTMKVVSIREVEPEWYEITLRQADSTNFTAPTGTITIVDPPTIVEAPVLPDAPGTLTLGETVNINNDGTAISTVTATWVAGENAATYVVAVKQGASEIEYGTGSALTFSFRVVVGVAYQVRVRSVDTDGLKSDWTSYGTITPTGDVTPPGPPSGLTATGLFTSILLQWTNPTDKDFAAVQIWEASTNNFASATRVATVSNTIWARDGLAANVTRFYWLTAIDRTGNVSTKFPVSNTAGVSATTVALGSSDFPAGLKPVEIVSALPTTGNFQGRVVFLTTDNKLYRFNGTAFVATVPTTDLSGQITATQITDDSITSAKIAANAITASELAADSVTAGKIAAGAVAADQIAANAVTAAKILAGSVTADKLNVSSLSAINANIGTVTSGLIRSGASGMVLDLNNNRIQSGGFSADALTGFQLDGTSGTLTANSVTIAGGTSARRPFEFAFGAVQDGILSDEGTANVYFPLNASNTLATVFGTVRRTPTETIYNLEATVNPDFYAGQGLGPEVTSGAITGGYPRANGITCAPASALIFTASDGSDNEYFNGYLVVTQTGEIVLNFVGTGPGVLGNPRATRRTVGFLYNDADADPLFLETYDQTTVHVWKNVFTGGIRRIRVPDTVTVSGTATPVVGMRVWMWGAAGQEGSGRQGGPGGYVRFDHAITGGEMLSLLVGGYSGNGWGGVSSNYVNGDGQRAGTSFASQGGGGSFLWRGPTLRTALLGVAGGGGSGGRLRNGGCGGSATFGGGNGTTGTTMRRCVGITSLGDFVINDDSRGSASGGGGYVGGGRLGTGNPDNEAGKGGTNYVISTATGITNSSSAADANGAATGVNPPGTGQSVYVSGVGVASATEGAAGAGMICIQWLT
jgi:hypothetical protein